MTEQWMGRDKNGRACLLDAPGALTVERTLADDLRVLHADPQIWLAPALVANLAAGLHHPLVRFDVASPDPGDALAGSVLTIDGQDRRVVYVLREYLPGPGCWLAEWPD